MKRHKLQIMQDILLVIQSKGGTAKPTHVLAKANLSHNMMQKYLHKLEQKGLITIEHINNTRRILLTEQGHLFVMKFNEIQSFMNTFGIDE